MFTAVTYNKVGFFDVCIYIYTRASWRLGGIVGWDNGLSTLCHISGILVGLLVSRGRWKCFLALAISAVRMGLGIALIFIFIYISIYKYIYILHVYVYIYIYNVYVYAYIYIHIYISNRWKLDKCHSFLFLKG